jgi:hypothetical protein
VLQRGVRGDERVQGHGIGLSIVQDLIKDYRGELAVARSDELGGARFEVRCRLARDGARQLAPSRDALRRPVRDQRRRPGEAPQLRGHLGQRLLQQIRCGEVVLAGHREESSGASLPHVDRVRAASTSRQNAS